MSDEQITHRKTRIPPPMSHTTRVRVQEKLNLTERQDRKATSRPIKAFKESIRTSQSNKRAEKEYHVNPICISSPRRHSSPSRQSLHPDKSEGFISSGNINADSKSACERTERKNDLVPQHKILTSVQNLDCYLGLRFKNQLNEELNREAVLSTVDSIQSDTAENGQSLGPNTLASDSHSVPLPSTPPPAHFNKKMLNASVEPPKTPSGSSAIAAAYESSFHSVQNESVGENENSLSASQRIRLGLSALQASQNSLKTSQNGKQASMESGQHPGSSESEFDRSGRKNCEHEIEHIKEGSRTRAETRRTSESNTSQTSGSASIFSQPMSPKSSSLRRTRRSKSEMLVARLLPVTQNVNDLLSYVHELRRSETLLKLQLDHSRRELEDMNKEYSIRITRLEREIERLTQEKKKEVARREQCEEDIYSLQKRIAELENLLEETREGNVDRESVMNGSKLTCQDNASSQNGPSIKPPEHRRNESIRTECCSGSELELLTSYGPTNRPPVFTITPPTSESLLLARVATNEIDSPEVLRQPSFEFSNERKSTTHSERSSTVIQASKASEQLIASSTFSDFEAKTSPILTRTFASNKRVTFKDSDDQVEISASKNSSLNLEKRLRAFFQKTDVSRIKMAQIYAKRYSDREDILLNELIRRYGEDEVASIRIDHNGGDMSQISNKDVDRAHTSPNSFSGPDAIATLEGAGSIPAHKTRKPTLSSVSILRPSSSPESPCMSPHNFSLAPPSLFHGRQNAQPFSMIATVFDEEKPVIDELEEHLARNKEDGPLESISTSGVIEKALPILEGNECSSTHVPSIHPVLEQLQNGMSETFDKVEEKKFKAEACIPNPCSISTAKMIQNSLDIKDTAPAIGNVPISSGVQKHDPIALEELLQTFFRRHQPGKVNTIPQLIAQFTGQERRLVEHLRAEYGSFSVRQLEQHLPAFERCHPRTVGHLNINHKKGADMSLGLRCMRAFARLLIRLFIFGILVIGCVALFNVLESDRLLHRRTNLQVDQRQCTAKDVRFDWEGNHDLTRWLDIFDFQSSDSSSLTETAQQQQSSTEAICFAVEWRRKIDQFLSRPLQFSTATELLHLIPFSDILIVPFIHIFKAQMLDCPQYQKFGRPVVRYAQIKLHKIISSLNSNWFDHIHVMAQRLQKLYVDARNSEFFVEAGKRARSMSVFHISEFKSVQSQVEDVFFQFRAGTKQLLPKMGTLNCFNFARIHRISYKIWSNSASQVAKWRERFSNENVANVMHHIAIAYKSLAEYVLTKCEFAQEARHVQTKEEAAIVEETKGIDKDAESQTESNLEQVCLVSPSCEIDKAQNCGSLGGLPSRWSVRDDSQVLSEPTEVKARKVEEDRVEVMDELLHEDSITKEIGEIDAFKDEIEQLEPAETLESGDSRTQSTILQSSITTVTDRQNEGHIMTEEQHFTDFLKEAFETQPEEFAGVDSDKHFAERVEHSKNLPIIFTDPNDHQAKEILQNAAGEDPATSREYIIKLTESRVESSLESHHRGIDLMDVVIQTAPSLADSDETLFSLSKIEIDDVSHEETVQEADEFRSLYDDLLDVTAELATQELDLRTSEG
ncbi:unnamed protein product [Albugo candida]|uniref:Uncharacterized protein n=1 Tax=Albugo candida TaxID=65357 RepID=A0A024G222_9STRA|nr:unnamed protein product [Albugo candida]|eukprot:CCI40353.1 unnamed protein product [Albugo candida]